MTTPGRQAAIRAGAEAMEDAALRLLGRDLGTAHREDIAAAFADAYERALAEQPREERVEWGNEDGIEEPMDYTPVGQREREALRRIVGTIERDGYASPALLAILDVARAALNAEEHPHA